MENHVIPCCSKCGASESHLEWKSHPIQSHTGDLIYCGKCGAILTWVYRHPSFASTSSE